MKIFLILLILFTAFPLYAKGVKVDWVCPATSSQKISVEVTFDDQGKLSFNPNVFEDNDTTLSSEQLQTCIKNFQQEVSETISSFRNESCPASKDDFCYPSLGYIDTKVHEKISSGSLLKKFPNFTVPKLGTSSSSSTSSTPTSSSTSGSSVETATTAAETYTTPSASAQSFLEEKIQKNEIQPKDLNQSFNFEGKNYKVSDFDTVIGDNIENVFSELNYDEARQYAQNYMVENSGVLNDTTPSTKRTNVLNNLNKMFGYIYGEKGQEELAKILECKPEDALAPVEEILKTLETTTKISGCGELEPGQHKLFSKNNNNFYSTGDYLLKRKQDGNYQVLLNVEFKQAGGSVSPQQMLERSRRCMAMASPAMKGPDGKQLEMLVLTPEEANDLKSNERPNKKTITIEGPNHGTNAASYAENVDCATITHELLHLLGLCDEYKEVRPQYANLGWHCRVVTKAPSIMRDLRTFDDAIGKTMKCDCNGNPCKAVMNSGDDNLKELFLSKNATNLIDYGFRNTYCKQALLKDVKSLSSNPTKGAVLLSDTESEFTVESRYLSANPQLPYSIVRDRYTCKCPAGNIECLNEKRRIVARINKGGRSKSCPFLTGYKGSEEGVSSGSEMKVENNILSFGASASLPSLLQPNHFNKILEGNCPGKANGYRECAEHAYKGTTPCNIPDRCKDDNYYLGSEQ